MHRRHPSASWLSLLRVLFPSYRFFEDVAPLPSLWVRVLAHHDDADTPFRELLTPPARRLRQLFWNPAGNLHLAQCALLERLLDDLAEAGPITLEDAQRLPSYRMVAVLAREQLAAPADALVQFKLRDGDPAEDVFMTTPERA